MNILFRSLFIITIVALSLPTTAQAKSIVWADGVNPVTYQTKSQTSPVVDIALEMLSSDLQMVVGQSCRQNKNATIVIYQLDNTKRSVQKKLEQQHIPVSKIISQMDAFWMGVRNDKIIIAGNNGRGTAYALLELSRMAGVSPWVWWGDVIPEKRQQLLIDESFESFQAPSVAYRGIFINDEDWSIRNWAGKTFEPNSQKGYIGPKTYKEIFKLLLRLRGNALWPAMHEGTTGFFTVKGNREVADSCGILIGTSHCEPLLRNNVAEWDKSQRGAYNFITNRDNVKQYWTERLQEVKGTEQLFTIGMRGIHDGAMEGVKTPEEKLNGLQQVIDTQRELIANYYNKHIETVPQVFIPYKEVLEIMESGLRIPDDVTLMWCDDNYGYLTRLSDSAQQQRSGGGGVYYHLSYWGRPHDYLWLTTTQPGLIYTEMKTAYDHNCRRLWIANVHDPKVAAYDLELFMDMAWDIHAVQPQTIVNHLEKWLCTQFGNKVGRLLTPVMVEWYHLNAIRRPEFMGWTQTELDKKKYPRGLSTVSQLQLSQQEAAERIEAFGRLKATVDKCRLLVRSELQDAFFAHIVYPVYAAAAMTRKLVSDSRESHHAYEEIQELTCQYNQLAGEKWNGLMDAAPRRLPVFEDTNGQLRPEGVHLQAIAMNACQYTRFIPTKDTNQQATSLQMLGHSMQAVSIPKGGELVFEFSTRQAGDALLYTAMIPTHASDRGELRYQLTLDNQPPVVISLKEAFRSEPWKQNVLRGQSLKKTKVNIVKAGNHTLRIKALDDHIIADQLMLSFSPDCSFYAIPAPASQLTVTDTDPLAGKKIGFIGDSYVRNHREPIENTWHYKFSQKHHMEYYNYGRNGNCIALDLKQWGTGMYKRYLDMRPDLDYVVVIAGHNDASGNRLDSIGLNTFKERLGLLCQGLKERYPKAGICFFTPWTCEDFEGSTRQIVVDAMIEVCSNYHIPIFDAARVSNIRAASEPFRKIYFQGGKGTDTAHLNNRGHNLFLPVAEEFLIRHLSINRPESGK